LYIFFYTVHTIALIEQRELVTVQVHFTLTLIYFALIGVAISYFQVAVKVYSHNVAEAVHQDKSIKVC